MNGLKEKKETEIVSTGASFDGFTIEEIRFQRQLVMKEVEFNKMRFLKNWENIQKSNPITGGMGTTLPGKAGSMALKLVNGLNYMDYVLLGLSVFSGAKKVFSFFRRHRKR